MTRTEHLLTILAEECAEVAQRTSKALRFGLGEIQPGQSLTNADRIFEEYIDLMAVYHMLYDDGHLPSVVMVSEQRFAAKEEKVEKYLAFSAARGLVEGISSDPNYPHPEAKQ